MSTTTTNAKVRLSPWVALQHRDFRLLWLGQLVSFAGSQMQTITLNWHIYALTNSAVALGLIGLVRVAPIIVFSLVGGVFADARDRRRVLLVTQTLLMLVAAALGLVTLVGWVTAPMIYMLAALAAAVGAFDSPARQALVPNLVPKEHLQNALSLNILMSQAASIAGPALAGFVIDYLGIAPVYWINAASFLAVLVALVFIRAPAQVNTGANAPKITLGALTEGLHFVWTSPLIASTMLLDFFATFFSSASALLPIFARDILHVGATGLGLLGSADAVGALIAGSVLAAVGNLKRQGVVLLVAIGCYGIATVLYGASQWFLLSLLFLGLVGASDMVSTILRNTIRQLATPDHLRGRMTSVNMMFFMGGPQLGELEAGVLAALVGAPLSVISGGVATLLFVALTAWAVPQLRNYKSTVNTEE